MKRPVGVVATRIDEKNESIIDIDPKGPLRGRGNHKRRSLPAPYKLEVIHEYENGNKADAFVLQYGINRTLLIKWVKDKIKIGAAAKSDFKDHLKIQPARKHKPWYNELLEIFEGARGKGYRIEFNWIWSAA